MMLWDNERRVIMDLANLIILALFVEAIVQTLKPLWD